LKTVTFCCAVSVIARKNFTLWESFFGPIKVLVSKGLYIILLARPVRNSKMEKNNKKEKISHGASLPSAKGCYKIFKKD